MYAVQMSNWEPNEAQKPGWSHELMIRKYIGIVLIVLGEMVIQFKKKKVKYGRIVTNETVSSILIDSDC